jgi:hypothetical protein
LSDCFCPAISFSPDDALLCEEEMESGSDEEGLRGGDSGCEL